MGGGGGGRGLQAQLTEKKHSDNVYDFTEGSNNLF